MLPREEAPARSTQHSSIRVAPDDLILAPFLGLVERAVLEVAHADGRAIAQGVLAFRFAVHMAVKSVTAQHGVALLQALLEIRTPSHRDLRYATLHAGAGRAPRHSAIQ